MRYLQIFAGIMILSHSHPALAIQTTEVQLQQFSESFEQQTLELVLSESHAEWDKQLNALGANQSIWLKSQWLRMLARLTYPSTEQQAWLEKQLNSDETLTIANPDHPNQQLIVINIAQQAKASQQHWKINQQVALFEKQWGTDDWRWQDVISAQNRLSQKAFRQWISTASQVVAEQVAEGYLTQIISLTLSDNRLLALLAEHGKSPELYARLWQNSADEYSYQALAKLPEVLEESSAIEQSVLANTNKKLQSQALFLLAERYSHNLKAQQTLLATLDDPEAKWLAAAAFNKITDQDFLAQIDKKLTQQKPSNFRTLALKNLHQITGYEAIQ